MTENEWMDQLADWSRSFEVKPRLPAGEEQIESLLVVKAPNDLLSFYRVANGLRSEWFNVLPVYRSDDPKNTWESANRANDIKVTRFLNGDEELLERFFVFAEIGGGCCACIDREDQSIWFEDEEGIHQTDLDLRNFIETMLLEVRNL